jgi:hypothetical protein
MAIVSILAQEIKRKVTGFPAGRETSDVTCNGDKSETYC